jgi:hypothetical protein
MIIWSFLVGVTLTQLVCTGLMFRPRGTWLEFLGRYLGTPAAGLLGWMLAGAVVVLYVGYSASTSPVVRRYALHPGSWGPYIGIRLVAILMAFVTGFFEEAFFRKFLMDAGAAQGYGMATQIIGSALIFGAMHAVWGVFGGKLRAAAAIMAVTSLLGALLAVVYVAAGRSIAPAIAAPVAINLILEPWLIMTSATGSWRQKALPA